jgi:hypothetical protein
MSLNSTKLAVAALAGLLTLGVTAATASVAHANNHEKAASSDTQMEKHACKGQNSCKGNGGCKTERNACKGHNECKGLGGCATDGSKK